MIDTLVFRLHIGEDSFIYHRFVKSYTQKTLRGQARENAYINFRVFDYGNKITERVNAFAEIPSSTYEIPILYDGYNKWLQFNISVPKYLYMNNVCQYIYTHRDFGFTQLDNTLEGQKKRSYDLLKHFFNTFLSDYGLEKFDKKNIEIRRIDFCYNLLFDEELEMNKYYENLKRVRQRYLRDTSNKFRDYETALMYIGDGFSFKVYKKGVEFRKNTLQKLENDEKYWRIKEPLNYLANVADRTLRFEMTLQKKYMQKVFRSEFYRRKDVMFRKKLKQYLKKEIKDKALNVYMKKAYNLSADFKLQVSDKDFNSQKYDDTFLTKNVYYGKNFHEHLIDKFLSRLKNYKIEKYIAVQNNDSKIGKKIDALKREGYDVEAAFKAKLISKATRNRYLKYLREHNMSEVMVEQDFKVKFDYVRYNHEIVDNFFLINAYEKKNNL